MPSTDPFQRFVNPYAQGGAVEDSHRSARAAGRALAIGALGLGAVTVFTGTGLAAEADTGPREPSSESEAERETEERLPHMPHEPGGEPLTGPDDPAPVGEPAAGLTGGHPFVGTGLLSWGPDTVLSADLLNVPAMPEPTDDDPVEEPAAGLTSEVISARS